MNIKKTHTRKHHPVRWNKDINGNAGSTSMPASPHEDETCISDGPVKGDIAIKKDNIFYMKNDGLFKMRTDGSDPQLLHSGNIGEHITISGGWVHFTVHDDGLYRTHRDGGDVHLLRKGNIRGRIAVSGSWVYYTELNGGLCRMWEDGSYVCVLVDDPSAELINVTEGHIYFTKNETKDLYRSWEDGDNKEHFDIFGKVAIHVADGWIYSKDSDGTNFYRMKIDRTKMNRSQMELNHEHFHRIRHVDTADGRIYYDADGSLFRMSADGSDSEKLSDGTIEGVRKVIDDHIYCVRNEKLFRELISRSR